MNAIQTYVNWINEKSPSTCMGVFKKIDDRGLYIAKFWNGDMGEEEKILFEQELAAMLRHMIFEMVAHDMGLLLPTEGSLWDWAGDFTMRLKAAFGEKDE